MEMITLKCENCGKDFERELKFHTYRNKRGMRMFCGKPCSTAYQNKHRPKSLYQKNIPRLRRIAGNKRDEFSPFRTFISKCKQRKYEWDIDLPYLKTLWEQQNGVCPYTGLQMLLPETSTRGSDAKLSPKQASLDRIDSTKGYLKGNVEFVCLFINFAKNGFTKVEVERLIDDIKASTTSGQIPLPS